MAVQRNNSGMRPRGAGTGRGAASRPTSRGVSSSRGAMPRNGAGTRKTGTSKKRKISKKQQAIYRRRRIVVGVVLVLVVALIGFCVYSLARGFGAINMAIHHNEVYAISRSATPTPKKTSGVKDCSAKNLTLELSSRSQSVPVGGSLDFTATIIHDGSGSCLVDASNDSRILTISSGHNVVYKSDVCPADARMLLMAKGDKDVQQMTWNANANATLTECTDEADWPKVEAGNYSAQLSLKDNPKVKSDPVAFSVTK